MQFFSMLLYFHRKNKINDFSIQVFFKLFVKLLDNSYFAELLYEAYLEPSRRSTMERFCENSES